MLYDEKVRNQEQELARKQVLNYTIKLINYTTSQLHHETLVNQQTHQQERNAQVGNNGSLMSWAEEHYIEAALLSLLLLVGVIVAVKFVVTRIRGRGRRVTNPNTGAAEHAAAESFPVDRNHQVPDADRHPGQAFVHQGADGGGAPRNSFQAHPDGPDEVPSGHPDHGPTAEHSGQPVVNQEAAGGASLASAESLHEGSDAGSISQNHHGHQIKPQRPPIQPKPRAKPRR